MDRGISSTVLMTLLCSLAMMWTGCTGSTRGRSHETQESARPEPTPSHEVSDPTCCGFTTYHQGIDQAWRLFTQDGQFRLVLEKDMRFSGAARSEIVRRTGRIIWSPLNQVFAYSWGHLGYDTDQDLLAVIVVDDSRTEDSRYGLVIFGKPKGGTYRPYWLYQNRDLSKTVVYQVTGSLGVGDYHDNGTYKNCWVEWNSRRNQFICR
jgi:hypothetical protein